jgi:hypothetical protein
MASGEPLLRSTGAVSAAASVRGQSQDGSALRFSNRAQNIPPPPPPPPPKVERFLMVPSTRFMLKPPMFGIANVRSLQSVFSSTDGAEQLDRRKSQLQVDAGSERTRGDGGWREEQTGGRRKQRRSGLLLLTMTWCSRSRVPPDECQEFPILRFQAVIKVR